MTTLLNTAGGEVTTYSPRSRIRMPCARSTSPFLPKSAQGRPVIGIERDQARVERAREDAPNARTLAARRRIFPDADPARRRFTVAARAIDAPVVAPAFFARFGIERDDDVRAGFQIELTEGEHAAWSRR